MPAAGKNIPLKKRAFLLILPFSCSDAATRADDQEIFDRLLIMLFNRKPTINFFVIII